MYEGRRMRRAGGMLARPRRRHMHTCRKHALTLLRRSVADVHNKSLCSSSSSNLLWWLLLILTLMDESFELGLIVKKSR